MRACVLLLVLPHQHEPLPALLLPTVPREVQPPAAGGGLRQYICSTSNQLGASLLTMWSCSSTKQAVGTGALRTGRRPLETMACSVLLTCSHVLHAVLQYCGVLHNFLSRAFPAQYAERAAETRGEGCWEVTGQ